jgi:hypothetical protein
MPNQTEPNANNALGDGFAPKVSLIRDFWCKAALMITFNPI